MICETPLRKLLKHYCLGGIPYTEYGASGNPVTFITNVAKPLLLCAFAFAADQSGSGDPSPENVRPITGKSGLTIKYSGADLTDYTEYTCSFGETVYGGFYDFVAGRLTVTHVRYVADGTDISWSLTDYGDVTRFYFNPRSFGLPQSKASSSVRFNYLKEGTSNVWTGYISSSGNILLRVPSDVADTKELWNAYLAEHNLEICYELNDPVSCDLTPEEITALIGENNIWCEEALGGGATYLKR